MNKHFQIYAIAALMVVGTLAVSAYALDGEQKSVPRYSETCAHGHNSFDCKTPQYRVDIDDLQERVTALERAQKPSQ